MPPSTPDNPRPLPPGVSIESASKSPDALLGLYSLDAMDTAIKACEFDSMEEVDFLVQIMRDPTADTSHRLAAHRSLRHVLKEVMTANGLIGTARAEEVSSDGKGNLTRRIVSTNALLTRFKKDLEHGSPKEGNNQAPRELLLPRTHDDEAQTPRHTPSGTPTTRPGTDEGRGVNPPSPSSG